MYVELNITNFLLTFCLYLQLGRGRVALYIAVFIIIFSWTSCVCLEGNRANFIFFSEFCSYPVPVPHWVLRDKTVSVVCSVISDVICYCLSLAPSFSHFHPSFLSLLFSSNFRYLFSLTFSLFFSLYLSFLHSLSLLVRFLSHFLSFLLLFSLSLPHSLSLASDKHIRTEKESYCHSTWFINT